MDFNDIIFQLPPQDMLEEILSKVPNIPVETHDFYWIGGLYPKHCIFVDNFGNINDCKNKTSTAYNFTVRPVLYFKDPLPGKPGDPHLVCRPIVDENGNCGLSGRMCIIIDKYRAIVAKPLCNTDFHEDWDAWLNSPSFKEAW